MRKKIDKLKKCCAKSGLYAINNVRGITLTTLVVTIVVLLILAGVATYSGMEAIDNTKRTKFIAELKIMQSYVNKWYEDCKPSMNSQKYAEDFATNITNKFTTNGVNAKIATDSTISSQSSTALSAASVPPDNYGRFYLLGEDQKAALGVEGVSQDVLVSVQDRKVVSYLGLKYKGNMYYTIDSLDGKNGIDAIYNVGYDNPNSGQPAFQVKSECTEPGISKITVYDVQYDTGYNTKWKVYYKKDYDTNWKSSDDLSFTVTDDGVYTIKLTNQNGDIVGTTTTEIGAFAYKKKNSALSGINDKTKLTSKNPVIPQGFKAVDTDTAKWKYTNNNYNEIQGWNDGLVIEDDIGNQFVWVPCSLNEITENDEPTIVRYSKDFSYSSYDPVTDMNMVNAFDTTTVNGIKYSAIPVREQEQIYNYGGFYVARFEAGLPTETIEQSAALNNVYTSIPVSKYGSKIWNYIDYTHSYVNAEKMINNASKYGKNKSGLITGTQWDTIMKWYEYSGIGVEKTNKNVNGVSVPAQNWGTYKNRTYTFTGLYCTHNNSDLSNWNNSTVVETHAANDYNISGAKPAHFHSSGGNSDGCKKNIYDLGGNFWEWTSETSNDNRFFRGGNAHDTNTSCCAAYRSYNIYNAIHYGVSFRPVLYIQDEPQKEYVTDGLLAYYDAENNTGIGHSFDTTTWKDLSGNNNDATLYGFNNTAESGWHSNYLAFDGENDYASKNGITVDGANGTIEIIGKFISGATGASYMYRSNYNSNNASEGRTYIWGDQIVKGQPAITINFNTNNIYNNASRVLKYYTLNGRSYALNYYNMNKSDEQEYQNTTNGSFLVLGSYLPNSASQLAKMQVYAVRIYNRALTEDEIRQNYEIDKVRFNIQD